MKTNFNIEVGNPREDFQVTYSETHEGIEKILFAEIDIVKNFKHAWFSKNKEAIYLYLDSISEWKHPAKQMLTINEYQIVLKRLIEYFENRSIKVILK